MLTGPDLERRLRALAPSPPPAEARLAAVALLLRLGEDPRVLLMRRAVREGDAWSGQVGLPGGHAEPVDADLLDTARRETHEEVGLRLERMARPLGRLPVLQARARRRRLPLFVAPFVFEELRPEPVELGPEAARAFWFPLRPALAGELDHRHAYSGPDTADEPVPLHFPSWRYEDEVVWGMTHHILGGLLDVLDPNSARPPRSSGPLPRPGP